MDRIIFLFGAGISLPAGVPNSETITERILSGEGVCRFTDGNFYFDIKNPMCQVEPVAKITAYLNILWQYINGFYNEKKKPNYEDLYYLARQVADSYLGEVENPGLGLLLADIRPKVEPLLEMREEESYDISFVQFADDVCNYMLDVVAMMISDNTAEGNHLGFVKDACADTNQKHVDIFTLNHDTILERSLLKNVIPFVDGFEKEIHGTRWWLPTLFQDPDAKIRLIKLHGSVSWYRMRIDPDLDNLGRVGIVLNGDHWHALNPKGQRIMSLYHRPMILAGTFNKVMEYSSDIFAETFYLFLQSLKEGQVLIICGYSFGDKGVNTAIVEWMYSNDKNRIVLIHGNLDELKTSARWAIAGKLDEWVKSNRVVHIPKWIQDVSWKEVESFIA